MSLVQEKKRLLQNIKAYKKSLPDPPEPAEDLSGLPNDASRANKAIRTRERRHGSSKLTPEGKQKLSQPKK